MNTLSFKAKGLLMMGCLLAASIESASALKGMTPDNKSIMIESVTITESPLPALKGKTFTAHQIEKLRRIIVDTAREAGVDATALANFAKSSDLAKKFAFTATGKKDKAMYTVTFDKGVLLTPLETNKQTSPHSAAR